MPRVRIDPSEVEKQNGSFGHGEIPVCTDATAVADHSQATA